MSDDETKDDLDEISSLEVRESILRGFNAGARRLAKDQKQERVVNALMSALGAIKKDVARGKAFTVERDDDYAPQVIVRTSVGNVEVQKDGRMTYVITGERIDGTPGPINLIIDNPRKSDIYAVAELYADRAAYEGRIAIEKPRLQSPRS